MPDNAGVVTKHQANKEDERKRDTDGECLCSSLSAAFVFCQEKQCRKQAANNEQQYKNNRNLDKHGSLSSECPMIMRCT